MKRNDSVQGTVSLIRPDCQKNGNVKFFEVEIEESITVLRTYLVWGSDAAEARFKVMHEEDYLAVSEDKDEENEFPNPWNGEVVSVKEVKPGDLPPELVRLARVEAIQAENPDP